MEKFKAVLTPNPVLPNHVVKFDHTKCIACYQCVSSCRCNVIVENPTKGQPPILVYPEECWHCAVCTENCPTGAIEFEHPINQKITWKRKDTGEMFRIGMDNPPEPYTVRACGDRQVQLYPSEFLNVKVAEVEKVSRFVVRVKFESMAVDIPKYLPGHFCNVKIKEDVYRGYSISNPHDGKTVELFIDTFEEGIGVRFLENLKEAEIVEMQMPFGRFIYTAKDTPLLLFASGTGISPLKAMIDLELGTIKSGRVTHLFFQVWEEQDRFLKQYFDHLTSKYSNFTYTFAYESKQTFSETIKQSGYITEHTDAYICGAKKVIEEVERVLLDNNVFWRNIYYESFMQ
ncbi:hypothetical protein AN639_05030 [Candidatus Epulonipiscium fishelsonii]|uniref:Uncharacterized protein n=1 Tax=Candidatus Epulonipiscium fishelsonii TaxID=77094 RepID=A0ACC8XFP7_9FIRM|nr:hypothetical protein AN639_05030 [Epulopiscium sp. SCG-B05WGA-EpuloA1]ONI41962.1 hypothetical protein AN396_02505 [Epulopiscium sp. SCG-B11WGA-EpuloA1]